MRGTRLPIAVAVASIAATAPLAAQDLWDGTRPDADAPFGVAVDRLAQRGQLTLGYRYVRVTQREYRVEDQPVTTDSVLLTYPEAADRRTRETHELLLRFAPSDRLTFSATVPLHAFETDNRTDAGGTFGTSTSGMGDLSVDALYRVLAWNRQQLLVLARASVPTGAIDVTDATPAGGATTLLPYPMQPGTGSLDLRPGLAYLGQNNSVSWGLQFQMTFRTGDNDRGYRWGDGGLFTTWLSGRWADWISSSMRVEFRSYQRIQGEDAGLDPTVTPEADRLNHGGTQVDGMIGTNVRIPGGFLRGTSIGVELTLPMYVALNGPQLRDRGTVTVGARYGFRLLGN